MVLDACDAVTVVEPAPTTVTVVPEMVATFVLELVKVIGVTVFVDVKFVIWKEAAPTCFEGIDQFEEKVGVALYTVKLAVISSAR